MVRGMSVSVERRPHVAARRRGSGAIPWLVGIIVALSAAVIGLALWLIVTPAGQETQLPEAAQETLDGYRNAWAAFDGEGAMGFVTEGYAFVTSGNELDATAMAERVHYTAMEQRLATETVAEVISGDGSRYHVAQSERIGSDSEATALSVITLVERDGTWLVSRHEWLGSS